MQLKPSDIYFSQDSINNVFDKRCAHSYDPIGHTLDALCTGRCRVSDIPTITVVEKDGKWVTADNRRLWVFREMERLGKCDKIPVYEGYSIPSAKMTSYNGGISVHVRGSPGGTWHNKPSARKPPASNTNLKSKATYSTNNFSNIGILTDQAHRFNVPTTAPTKYNTPTFSSNHSNAMNPTSSAKYLTQKPDSVIRSVSSSSASSSAYGRARRTSPVTTPRATITRPEPGPHTSGYCKPDHPTPVYQASQYNLTRQTSTTNQSWTDKRNSEREQHDTITPQPAVPRTGGGRSTSPYRVSHESPPTYVPTPSQRRKDQGCCIII